MRKGLSERKKVVEAVGAELESAGLRARIIARDLDSHAEVALSPEGATPLASLVKVPIALAVLNRIEAGEFAADEQVRVDPAATGSASPTGAARFRHPARLAIEDLLTLAVCFSDNTAADALLDLVPVRDVQRELDALGLRGSISDTGSTHWCRPRWRALTGLKHILRMVLRRLGRPTETGIGSGSSMSLGPTPAPPAV